MQVGLPEAVAKRCVHQVAIGLDFLHGRKLVHRDIKPENVLIFDRECRKVKLSDFGMTRRAGSPVKRVSGTIPYTAPELCDASRRDGFLVEPSTDVWAFGVLLFCMLTGNFPWEKALPSDAFYDEFSRWQRAQRRGVLGGITGSPGPVPSQWRRFTDEALRMFRKLLALDPQRRCSVKEVFHHFGRRWMVDSDLGIGVGVGVGASGTASANASSASGGGGSGNYMGSHQGGLSSTSEEDEEDEDLLVDRMKQQTLSPGVGVCGGPKAGGGAMETGSPQGHHYGNTMGGVPPGGGYERMPRDNSSGGRILVTTPIEICV